MQDADQRATNAGGLQAETEGHDLRIGIVQARFNTAITDALAHACLAEPHGPVWSLSCAWTVVVG